MNMNIRDHYFRNVDEGGNLIVEAIEQLERDVDSLENRMNTAETNISDTNERITNIATRLDLHELENEQAFYIVNEKINKLFSGDYTFVKWHGAVGDGITDDTAAIQAALDSGKTYIIFDKGTYLVSSAGYGKACLLCPSNRHLIGLGATILNNTSSSISIVNKSPALEDPTAGGVYSANTNIIISNLNFRGTNNNSLGCLGFAHCDNVKIFNCNFTDLGGWHFIELNSTHDAIISGCTFKNYDGPNLTEMIQLDMATHADVFPFFGPYDNTPCQNIIIENCFFSGPLSYYNNSDNYFKLVPAAIGSHNASATPGENNQYVTIRGCYFINLQTCVKFAALRNSIIEGNQAIAVRHFFNANDMESESTAYFAGIKITNNRLITSPLSAEVVTAGQSTRTRCIGFGGINCEISGNDIYGWSGYAINVTGVGHVISNNSIMNCGRKAIYVYGNDNNIFSGNKAIGNCTYNMDGDADIVVVPDGNSSPANNNLITGNVVDTMRLTNPSSTKTAVTNNNILTALTVSAGDACIVHNNLVNGSWSA